MAAIVIIVSMRGLGIKAHHRNQPNKSKLVLYNMLLYCNISLKQLYISNKMEWFNYKDGYGICGYTCIKVFKHRAFSRYRQVVSGYL